MAGSCAGEATALGGAPGWDAPSMNIHRAPFTGRNGEYYSEDGFLSGVIGLLEVVRWVSTGVSVVGLGPIGFTAWRNHAKRRAERAEQE